MSYNNFSPNSRTLKFTANLNYFSFNSLNKIVNFYYFIQFFTNQKPFLKKVSFKNIKKKRLKTFRLILTLRRKPFINFFNYLKLYYFYFYTIYYTKQLQYSHNRIMLNYHLNNPYFFYKNYKLNYKLSLKISLPIISNEIFLSKH